MKNYYIEKLYQKYLYIIKNTTITFVDYDDNFYSILHLVTMDEHTFAPIFKPITLKNFKKEYETNRETILLFLARYIK